MAFQTQTPLWQLPTGKVNEQIEEYESDSDSCSDTDMSDASSDDEDDFIIPVVPSIEECLRAIMIRPGRDNFIFYTGRTEDFAGRLAEQTGGVILRGSLKGGRADESAEGNLGDWATALLYGEDGGWSDDETDVFWQRMSVAFASLASGRVRLTLPAGGVPRDSSVWSRFEEKVLQNNGMVTEIVAIYEGGGEQVLWTNPELTLEGF